MYDSQRVIVAQENLGPLEEAVDKNQQQYQAEHTEEQVMSVPQCVALCPRRTPGIAVPCGSR